MVASVSTSSQLCNIWSSSCIATAFNMASLARAYASARMRAYAQIRAYARAGQQERNPGR
jgi:hypothetical protein